MISMYNKLCDKQDGFFFLVGHICIRDKDHQMIFERHINHLNSSNHVCFMVTSLNSILFYNVNNNLKGFHKL